MIKNKLLKNQLIKICDQNLSNLFTINSYEDLDLPCEFKQLISSKWEIQETTSPHFTLEKIYRVKKQFTYNHQVVAIYTLYYDFEMNFLDEWFVSY